ncbi:MAG: hypothetical protein CL793_05815 [Chloroflexi bacterium]|nr:hypothetical protein [Chloroflexota bacterium]
MNILRRFIAIILLLTLIPVSSSLAVSSLIVSEVSDPIFWKNHLHDSGLYSILHTDQVLQDAVIESLISEEPSSDIEAFMEEAIARALLTNFSNPEWIEGTTVAVVDEAIPYLSGKSDSLTIQPELTSRIAPVLNSLEESLISDEFYDILLIEAWKALETDLSNLSISGIPLQISITEKAFIAILQSNETREWYIQTATILLDDMEAYLEDQTTVPPSPFDAPFEALVIILSPQIATVIDTQVERIFSFLPSCSLQEIVDATATNPSLEEVGIALITSTSPCVPPGITYPMAKELLNVDLEQHVSDLMSEMLSDVIQQDIRTDAEAEILDILGPIKCAIHNPPIVEATAITIPNTDTHSPCTSKMELEPLQQLAKTRNAYLPAITVLQSPFALPISLLLALIPAVIGSPSLRGKLKWLSGFAILYGTIILAAGGALWTLGSVVEENIATEIPQEYPTLSLVISDFLGTVSHSLSGELLPYGSLIGISGIGVFVIVHLARRRGSINSSQTEQ